MAWTLFGASARAGGRADGRADGRAGRKKFSREGQNQKDAQRNSQQKEGLSLLSFFERSLMEKRCLWISLFWWYLDNPPGVRAGAGGFGYFWLTPFAAWTSLGKRRPFFNFPLLRHVLARRIDYLIAQKLARRHVRKGGMR